MTLSDARQHRRPSRRWGRNPRAERASPDDPHHPSSVPCPLPRRIETGARVGSFPVPRGLPRISGGSASATSLSRPAQASLTLRPAGSLNRPRRPLSQGFGAAGYPAGPLASYQIKPTTVWMEPSSTGDARRLGAPRSPGSRTGSIRTCQGLRPRRVERALALTRPFVLPSAVRTASAPGTTVLSRLNGWPMRTPTDASPPPSRTTAHGSGPMRIATPSSQWTCTTYSLPVSRRTLTNSAEYPSTR